MTRVLDASGSAACRRCGWAGSTCYISIGRGPLKNGSEVENLPHDWAEAVDSTNFSEALRKLISLKPCPFTVRGERSRLPARVRIATTILCDAGRRQPEPDQGRRSLILVRAALNLLPRAGLLQTWDCARLELALGVFEVLVDLACGTVEGNRP